MVLKRERRGLDHGTRITRIYADHADQVHVHTCSSARRGRTVGPRLTAAWIEHGRKNRMRLAIEYVRACDSFGRVRFTTSAGTADVPTVRLILREKKGIRVIRVIRVS